MKITATRTEFPLRACGATDWLGLAAAPTFAVMALLVGVFDVGPNMPCSVGVSSLGGMAPMYWLMSVFHAGPWLRLLRHSWSSA